MYNRFMVEQNPGNGSEKIKVPEYKLLPPGSAAVVFARFDLDHNSANRYGFRVAIGESKHFHVKDMRANFDRALSELKEEKFEFDFYVPRGKNEGLIGLRPLEERYVEIVKTEEGRLLLALYYDSFDHASSNSNANMRSSAGGTAYDDFEFFKSRGLDILNKDNPDYHGLVLGEELSQYLYDFQRRQGKFTRGY